MGLGRELSLGGWRGWAYIFSCIYLVDSAGVHISPGRQTGAASTGLEAEEPMAAGRSKGARAWGVYASGVMHVMPEMGVIKYAD